MSLIPKFFTLNASDDAIGASFALRLQRHGRKTYPPCFQSYKQYDVWKDLARMSRPHSGFCTDCTPEHKFEMESQNRCLYPKVIFKVNKEGDLEGYFPAQLKKELRNLNEKGTSL